MAYVEIQSITKSFDEKKVLNQVSFEIMKGECFGLLGPNGAGKSTLIDIITGLKKTDQGEVLIDGRSIKEDALTIRQKLGVVPQELAIIEELNAVDNLTYFGGLYGLYGNTLKERIAEILAVTGLEEKKKEKVKTFSGGMKRRLNIGIALLHQPEFLILDEPTVGVDPQSRQHIFDFLETLNQQGTTILYTSHYMEEVEALCDRVFIMDLGEEVAYGTKEYVKELVGLTYSIEVVLDRIPQGFEQVVLDSENGIQEVTIENRQMNLVVDRSIYSMMKFISLVEENHLVIKKVSVNETTLEEAFLKLTGKALRD